MKPTVLEGSRIAVPECQASPIRPLARALVAAGMVAALAFPVPDVLAAEVGVPILAREAARGVKGSAGRATGRLNDPAHVGVYTSQPMAKSGYSSAGVSASLGFYPSVVMQGGVARAALFVGNSSGYTFAAGASTLNLPGLQVANPANAYVSPQCGGVGAFAPAAGSSSISIPAFSVTTSYGCGIEVDVSAPATGAFAADWNFSGTVNGYDIGASLNGSLEVFAPPSASISFSPGEINPYGSSAAPTSSSLTLTLNNAHPYVALDVSGTINLDGLAGLITESTCDFDDALPTVPSGNLQIPQYLYVLPGSCTISASVSSSTARTYNVPPAPVPLDGSYYYVSYSMARKTAAVTVPIPVSSGSLLVGIPLPSLSPTSLAFPARDVGTTSPPQVVTLTNSGTGAMSNLIIGASGDFAATHTCGSSLAIASSCTISTTFTPTMAGARIGSLSVASNAAGSPHTVGLTGTGTVLGLTVSKTFNPTSVLAGAPASLKVMLANPNALPMSAVEFTDTFPAGLASNGLATSTCGGTVTSAAGSLALSGGAMQANGGCELTVPVTSSAVGSYTNTVGAGSVTAMLSTTPSPTAVSNAAAASAVLQVTPVPAPGVSFTPGSMSFGSVTVNTVSGVQPVTIANSGAAPLNFSGAFAVTGPFAHVSACPPSLVPQQSCTVDVKFVPTATGPASGSLVVTSNAPGSPHSLPLSGTGQPAPTAGVSLAPASLAFGAQTLATTSSARSVTLSNTGSGVFTLRGITTSGDFAQSNNCTADLAPGSSCLLTVTFRPVVVGTRTGSLQVASNAPGSPHAVSLTGQGEAPPVPGVDLVPGAVSFPETQVGSSSAGITVEVRNSGNAALQVSAVEIVGGGFRVVVHDCTRALSAGESCRVVVVFEPTTRGAASAQLRIASNAPSGPVTAGLTGSGIPVPVGTLEAVPGSLAFDGQVIRTTSAARTINVRNTGTAEARLSAIEMSGDFAQTNNCGTLQAGASCTVSVTFTPAAEGTRTGSLSIASNASNDRLVIGFSGTGLPLPIPVIELSASSLSFGNTTRPDESPNQTVTVRNSGGAPLAISGISVVGDFEATSACPGSLAIAGSCDVSVWFKPRRSGVLTGTLSVQSNASNTPSGSIDVGLEGIGCTIRVGRAPVLTCQ